MVRLHIDGIVYVTVCHLEVSATWVVEDTFKDVGEVRFKINIHYKHFISCLLPVVV